MHSSQPNKNTCLNAHHFSSNIPTSLHYNYLSYKLLFWGSCQPQAGFLVFTKAGSLKSHLTFTDTNLQISIWSHPLGLSKNKAEDLIELEESGLLDVSHWFLMQFHHAPLIHNPRRGMKVSLFSRDSNQHAFIISQWTSKAELFPGGFFCSQWREMGHQKSF